MIPIENRKLIDGIKAPKEHTELISTVIEACREYAKKKAYYPFKFGQPIFKSKYFCAYKQDAAPKGEGSAIVGFENRGEGLCLVFHYVIFDLKNLIIQTETDKKNGRRRIYIDRRFADEEIQHMCKLAWQCIDQAFA